MLGKSSSYEDFEVAGLAIGGCGCSVAGWAGTGAAAGSTVAGAACGGGRVVRAASSISVALDGGGVGGPVIFACFYIVGSDVHGSR